MSAATKLLLDHGGGEAAFLLRLDPVLFADARDSEPHGVQQHLGLGHRQCRGSPRWVGGRTDGEGDLVAGLADMHQYLGDPGLDVHAPSWAAAGGPPRIATLLGYRHSNPGATDGRMPRPP